MSCAFVAALLLSCQAQAVTVERKAPVIPRANNLAEEPAVQKRLAKTDQPAVIECRSYASPFESGVGMDRPAQDLLDVQSGGFLRPGGNNCRPPAHRNPRN